MADTRLRGSFSKKRIQQMNKSVRESEVAIRMSVRVY